MESTLTQENVTSAKQNWSASIKSVLGWGGEFGDENKRGLNEKFVLAPENMLNEILASLKARGSLRIDLVSALNTHTKTNEPVWVSGRFPFHAVQFAGADGLAEINRDRMMLFATRMGDGYEHDDRYYLNASAPIPQIEMSASLTKFPGLRDGQMGMSSHEAFLFRKLGASAYNYLIFGSLFGVGDSYQLKPYAIAT